MTDIHTEGTAAAAPVASSVTKGADDLAAIGLLEEPTRRRLYELVASGHEAIGRDAAAQALGISRELAAFHLDRLVAAGLLEAGYRRLGSRSGPGAGRPAKVYRRADREISVALPPRRYETIADLFAEELLRLSAGERQGVPAPAAVGEAARARGREAGAQARGAAGPGLTQAELQTALARVLAEAGYEPEAAADGSVSLCNCPYRAVAEAHRDLTCSVNYAWLQGLADGLGELALVPAFTPTPGRCCVTFGAEGQAFAGERGLPRS